MSKRLAALCLLVALIMQIGCMRDNPPAAGSDEDKSPSQPPAKEANQLSPEIVKSWRDAGASPGTFRWSPNLEPLFMPTEKLRSGDLPAFAFHAKVGPDPGVPFGLVAEGGKPDESLKELRGLKSLQVLEIGYLNRANMTDLGMKELAGLTSLQSLILTGTKVTDKGIKELSSLKNLQHLSLAATNVTNAGLKELAPLKNMQYLDLHSTRVSDMNALLELTALKTLNVSGCVLLSDAGLKELAGLKNLRSLKVMLTLVSDGGVKELARLDNLQELDLSGCIMVTDAGLKDLAGLKSLQALDLDSTQVTNAGVATFAKLLPQCKVKH